MGGNVWQIVALFYIMKLQNNRCPEFVLVAMALACVIGVNNECNQYAQSCCTIEANPTIINYHFQIKQQTQWTC